MCAIIKMRVIGLLIALILVALVYSLMRERRSSMELYGKRMELFLLEQQHQLQNEARQYWNDTRRMFKPVRKQYAQLRNEARREWDEARQLWHDMPKHARRFRKNPQPYIARLWKA